MRRCLALAAILLCPLVPPLPARGDDALRETTVERDLPYVEGEAVHERQHLDLHVPAGAGPWPVLMWIHGGAWAVGHRSDEDALARRFAERGVAVASIDHRMSKALWINAKLDTGVEHPVHVQDCAAAFAWLAKHAGAHRLDTSRMFVGGFSSGAHLAALLASDPRYLKAHGLEPSMVKGALPVGGAYDIEAYYRTHLEANGATMAEQHVLDVFGHGDGALADASPLTHVAKTQVPMLVLSERDTYGYTKVFEDALTEAGVTRIRFLHFRDRRHATIGRMMAAEAPDAARDAMIAFILDPSRLAAIVEAAQAPEATGEASDAAPEERHEDGGE